MRRFWKQVVLTVVLLLPSVKAQAGSFPVIAPTYPVIVKEAKLAETFQEDSNEPIYEQVFLPRSIIRIKGDLIVPYLQRGSYDKGSEPTKIGMGAVFVEANLQGVKVYCAALHQAKRSLLFVPDLGICLSDPDGSGTFTTMYSSYGCSVRHAYDVKHVIAGWGAIKQPAVTPIHIEYENVPVDDTYASKIEVRVMDRPPFEGVRWAPVLDISPKLQRPGLGDVEYRVAYTPTTGIMAVLGFPEDDIGFGKTIWWQNYSPKPDGKPLHFGSAISVAFEKKSEKLWKLNFGETIQPGNYLLHFTISDGLFALDPVASN